MNPWELVEYVNARRQRELKVDNGKQIEVIDEASQRVFLVDRATTDLSGRLVLIVKEAA